MSAIHKPEVTGQSVGKIFSLSDFSPVPLAELISDVTLKEQDCLDKLEKALKLTSVQAGTIEVDNVMDKRIKHRLTVIKNGEFRCLLAFPLQILLFEVRSYSDAQSSIESFRESLEKYFKEKKIRWNRKLYLVLPLIFNHLPKERLERYKAFYKLTSGWWRRFSIQVIEIKPELAFQDEQTVLDALLLEEEETSDLLESLSYKERKRLCEIIASLDVFTSGTKRRRLFVEEIAEFTEWTSTINFDATPKEVAGDLVDKLIERSINNKDNSLGKFLNHIIESGGKIPTPYSKWVKGLMKKYKLNKD